MAWSGDGIRVSKAPSSSTASVTVKTSGMTLRSMRQTLARNCVPCPAAHESPYSPLPRASSGVDRAGLEDRRLCRYNGRSSEIIIHCGAAVGEVWGSRSTMLVRVQRLLYAVGERSTTVSAGSLCTKRENGGTSLSVS
jgi:hypothetical protein